MPGLTADASPRVRHARRLFAGIAGGCDAMSEVLSFGRNRAWRRFLVSHVDVPSDARALDVATGTASVAIDLVRKAGARVVGVDQSPEMLRKGAARLRRDALDGRVALVRGRAERLPFPDAVFDAVTFTYLLRYVDDPAGTLAEMARVLRPLGVLASLEFGVPPNPIARGGWYAHTRLGLPVVGLVASREWFGAGRFLGPSISDWERRFPLDEQLRQWRRAGVGDARARRLTFGAGVVIWGRKDG
jgi:demethylmenaquinone methyltransferase / 2-methoxy-6-polyprenyl-1,4-benzoquinol methylase